MLGAMQVLHGSSLGLDRLFSIGAGFFGPCDTRHTDTPEPSQKRTGWLCGCSHESVIDRLIDAAIPSIDRFVCTVPQSSAPIALTDPTPLIIHDRHTRSIELSTETVRPHDLTAASSSAEGRAEVRISFD